MNRWQLYGEMLLCFMCAMMPARSVAQGHRIIEGTVSENQRGERLEGVNVLLYADKGKKLLKFTTTGKEGTFRLQVADSLTDKSYLQFSYMGYETLQKRNTWQEMWNVVLSSADMKIREIIVKAPRVKAQGDTLIYDVRSFSKEGDRSIGDVLRRMPGIQMHENGQLSYNGVPINRFYIENSDMLGGQYGVATRNIPNKEVGSVEVLQNHQPIRALEGLAFSEQAAVNLRLKEGAKHRWIGTLQLYAGVAPKDGLWNGQVTGMRFSKKHQQMHTLKSNNTGQDVSNELISFNRNELKYRDLMLPDYVPMTPPYSLGLKRERELMNQTHQVTTHRLLKSDQGPDIKVSLNYQRHQEEAMKTVEEVYYENQKEEWRWHEQEASDYARHLLSAKVATEVNQPTYNLTEQFQLDADWKDRTVDVSGTQHHKQQIEGNSWKAMNDLFLLKRKGNNLFTLSSYVAWHVHPLSFLVQAQEAEKTQQINQNQLFTDNNWGWGLVAGKFLIDMKVGLTGIHKQMDSRFEGVEDDRLITATTMNLEYWKLAFTPTISYTSGDFQSSIVLPANYFHSRYKPITEKSSGRDYLCFSPSFYSKWEPGMRWKFHIRGSFNQQQMDIRPFYAADILTTHRTLQRGLTSLGQVKTATASGGIAYNIPLKEYYSKLELSYARRTIPYTLVQRMREGYVHSMFVPDTRYAKQTSLSGSVSKGTEWAKTTCSLYAHWSTNTSYLVRNEDTMKSRLTRFQLQPEVDMTPAKWISIQYALRFEKESLSIKEKEDAESVYTANQSLLMRFLPTEKLILSVKGEHYVHQLSGEENRQFLLADVFLTYKFSKHFSMDARLTNLFNEKTYTSTSFSNEAVKISRRYGIRPRNLLIGGYVTF